MEHDFIIYTDGSAKENRAGIGIVAFRQDGSQHNHSEGIKGECNHQRAELLAILVALEAIPASPTRKSVLVISDSEYSIKCCTEYLAKWKLNGFRTAAKKEIKNLDVILRIDTCMQTHAVRFQHVNSHTGVKYNELADKLAERGRLGGASV